MSSHDQDRIEKAREEVAEGKLGRAIGTLTDIKDTTRDPDVLAEVKELATEAVPRAGRFSRGSWRSLLNDTEEKLAAVEKEKEMAAAV